MNSSRLSFLLGSSALLASGCASQGFQSVNTSGLPALGHNKFALPSEVEFMLSADGRHLVYGDLARANLYLSLVGLPLLNKMSALAIPVCTVSACPTSPPTATQSGDGAPVDSGLKTIGHVTARTTFPGLLTSPVTYQAQNYTGGGGIPSIPQSPIIGMRNSSTRVNCAGDLGINLMRGGIPVVGACVAWVVKNAGSLPQGAAGLLGAEEGAAVSVGEFLAVAVLALGPVEAIAMAAAAGLAAFELFLYIRCSLEN